MQKWEYPRAYITDATRLVPTGEKGLLGGEQSEGKAHALSLSKRRSPLATQPYHLTDDL
jgi:hypothetical protein